MRHIEPKTGEKPLIANRGSNPLRSDKPSPHENPLKSCLFVDYLTGSLELGVRKNTIQHFDKFICEALEKSLLQYHAVSSGRSLSAVYRNWYLVQTLEGIEICHVGLNPTSESNSPFFISVSGSQMTKEMFSILHGRKDIFWACKRIDIAFDETDYWAWHDVFVGKDWKPGMYDTLGGIAKKLHSEDTRTSVHPSGSKNPTIYINRGVTKIYLYDKSQERWDRGRKDFPENIIRVELRHQFRHRAHKVAAGQMTDLFDIMAATRLGSSFLKMISREHITPMEQPKSTEPRGDQFWIDGVARKLEAALRDGYSIEDYFEDFQSAVVKQVQVQATRSLHS